MVDVDHSARVRMSCTGEQIPVRSFPAPADDCQPGGLVGRAAWLAREFPASSPMHRAARDRVFAKIAVVEDASSCWLWTGAVNGRLAGLRDGYGVITVYIDGRRLQRGAHRVAREIASGVLIPGGLEVMHACDVPRCVRPSHLSVGSHADNMRDAALKGRRNRKLDDAAIREIAASNAPDDALAARFGVTSDYIGSIKAGRVRSYVERPIRPKRPAFVPTAGMDRNAAIVAARDHGDSIQVIADRHRITYGRVRHIVDPRPSISVSAAGYRAIRAVARARGVSMHAEIDAIINAGLDAMGGPVISTVDASLLRPVVRVDRDAFLAAIPRAPAWIALWELRAATGLTDAAIHRELRRQIGAGRVRASVVATCWQRRRAKAEAVSP